MQLLLLAKGALSMGTRVCSCRRRMLSPRLSRQRRSIHPLVPWPRRRVTWLLVVAVPVLAMMRKKVYVRCGQDAPPMVVVVVQQQLVLQWKRHPQEAVWRNRRNRRGAMVVRAFMASCVAEYCRNSRRAVLLTSETEPLQPFCCVSPS